jgi:hypothetical protein
MDEAPVKVRVNRFGSSQQTVTISLSPATQPAPATGKNVVARPNRQTPVRSVFTAPTSRPIR